MNNMYLGRLHRKVRTLRPNWFRLVTASRSKIASAATTWAGRWNQGWSSLGCPLGMGLEFAGALCRYIRNPQSENAQAQMPGNPGYDNQTIEALIAYFRTFSASTSPEPKP